MWKDDFLVPSTPSKSTPSMGPSLPDSHLTSLQHLPRPFAALAVRLYTFQLAQTYELA